MPNSLDSTKTRRYDARRASLPETGMSVLAYSNLTLEGFEKSKSPNQTGSVNHALPNLIHLFCRFCSCFLLVELSACLA
jgi:hypothetical protein